MDLNGKAAVVTGGSKGIGRAIATALAGAGANVVVCSRTQTEVNSAANEISSKGPGRCVGVVIDVRDMDQVRQVMRKAEIEFGGLDILVNNAGIGNFAHVSKMAPHLWNDVIDTNLTGVFYCIHSALPYMRKRGGGYIFNISSLAATSPFPEGSAYIASKAGLLAFSEAIVHDLRYENIKVSCILPGSVNTYFNNATPDKWESWKLSPKDVAQVVMDLLQFEARALPSRVEIRPSKPLKKEHSALQSAG